MRGGQQSEANWRSVVVIAAAAHPLAGRALELSDLAQQRWLMREAGSAIRMVTEQRLTKAGFVPQVAMSLGSNEAIKHAVAAGLGIAVISQLAVASALSHGLDDARQGLTVLDVSGFPIQRRWSVVWRNDQSLSAAARRFVAYRAGPVEVEVGAVRWAGGKAMIPASRLDDGLVHDNHAIDANLTARCKSACAVARVLPEVRKAVNLETAVDRFPSPITR